MEVTGVGTYGGIVATLDHIVRVRRQLSAADRGHGRSTSWTAQEPEADFDLLERWNDEAGVLWEEFLAKPIDVERVLIVDDNTRETRVGIFLAQAINHANHHREQVCAILTGLRHRAP